MKKIRAGYAAFMANKAFYDACESLKGKSFENGVDFDAYAYFELEAVPEHIDFGSKNKRFNSPVTRINEFRKYLCFITPPDLDGFEKKAAEGKGRHAAVEALKESGIESYVRWSYRG